MRRRSYLALLASVLGAGCVSDAGIGADPGTGTAYPSPNRTDDSPTPGSTDSTSTPDREPFETVTVGDPANVTDTENARPHTVSVANGGEARAIQLDV